MRYVYHILLMLLTAPAWAAEINDYDPTDANNTGRWPEGMAPSAVNDAGRADEGLLARWHIDIGGRGNTTGSSNAYILSATQSLGSLYDGLMLSFQANFANTGTVSLAVDGLTASEIKKNNDQGLASGDIEAGQVVEVTYDEACACFQMTSHLGNVGLLASNNLSDVTTAATALDNLGVDESSNVIALGDLVTAAQATGKQTMWVPSQALQPTVSNGAASLTQLETTAGRPDINYLAYDSSADEAAQFDVSFLKSWNEGTITFQVDWSQGNDDAGGVAWAIQCVSAADNDTIDVAYGTAIVVTDTAHAVTEDLMVTSESSAMTIAGSPAVDEHQFCRVFRDVSDGADTMAADAFLLGLRIFYTTDAANDN